MAVSVGFAVAASAGTAAPLTATPLAMIEPGGNRDENVGSDVVTIDIDGDGKLELLQFSGHRLIRLFKFDTDLTSWRKIWEVYDPTGRTNRDLAHRDKWAILDIDGDGSQEIIGCASQKGRKTRLLVIRNSRTGAIIRSRDLQDPNTGECRISAQRMVGGSGGVIMIARPGLPADGCLYGFLDTLSRVAAFNLRLDWLWSKSTCEAGHHFRPLDENKDGVAEAVAVGKYLVNRYGNTKCMYPNWAWDHIDSATYADIDVRQPGLEFATAGETGIRMYRASTCELLWEIPTTELENPQSIFVGRIDPSDPDMMIVIVRERDRPRAYRVDPLSGQLLGAFALGSDIKWTANLDGVGALEGISAFGEVYDGFGEKRLSRAWYWDLQTLTAVEQALPEGAQWSSRSLTADLDGNGRDELIVWGRQLLVIGRVSAVP
ncbi:MAG: hypothetical protein U1E14_00800 [Geminicoccaceae bacterium]